MFQASAGIAFLAVLLTIEQCSSQSNDQYVFSKGEIPSVFKLNQSYPNRSEASVCRPIRLRIDRGSARFRADLVVADALDATFGTADARVMTSRMHSRLAALVARHNRLTRTKLNVTKVWTPYTDRDITDPLSLHYEGRSALVSIPSYGANMLLHLAVEAGFDWVSYVSSTYVKLSVTPDACRTNVDLVFMVDRSSSIGQVNFNHALNFISSVVGFFDISPNATRVGLIAFSTRADVLISLDDYSNQQSLQRALANIRYTGGYTYTSGALRLAKLMLDPSNGYGTRPLSFGLPRVAVLITDGRSNVAPVAADAEALRSSGVQVFSVGIGKVELSELKVISSTPSLLHVFLLESFTVVYDLVQLLSCSTCDAPALMDPGTNTTSMVNQDGFRYFQGLCPVFSHAVVVEQTDMLGTSSLYASSSVQNPGPLSSKDTVQSNENGTLNRRSVMVTFGSDTSDSRNLYIAVRGMKPKNAFSLMYWDMVFQQQEYTINAPIDVKQFVLFNLTAQLKPINAIFSYSILQGNSNGYFSLTQETGILSATTLLPSRTNVTYVLLVMAQNTLHTCHRAKVVITIKTYTARLTVAPLGPVSLFENATIGTLVAQVRATGAGDSFLFSITAGNTDGAFSVGFTSGRVVVASQLNFEVRTSYNLTLLVQSTVFPAIRNTTILAVKVLDVDEPPYFVSPPCTNTASGCTFQVLENSTNGTLLGVLKANSSNNGCPSCGPLVFSIYPPQVPFSINQLGELRTAGLLNRELVSSYIFNVTVRDQRQTLLSSITVVQVTVLDVNDNPPVLLSSPVVMVLENAAVGTVITRIVARDADSGNNSIIYFTITAPISTQLPFRLNSMTGDLVLTGSLDREVTPLYNFNITLSNPTPGPVTTVTITVLVVDVNDNSPVFSRALYTAMVMEHSPLNTQVVTVSATDRDMGPNAMILYSITSGNKNKSFSINQTTGAIFISNDLSRDTSYLYTLVVMAIDGGVPPLTGTTTVQITIADINDHAPIFLQSSYFAVLNLTTIAPYKLLTLNATDQDEPNNLNSRIDYLIVGGNDKGLFAVNSTTGSFSLVMNLTSATLEPNYVVMVAAKDRGSPPLNSTAAIYIQVVDLTPTVADIPLDGSIQYNLTVSELVPPGVAIAVLNTNQANLSGVLIFSIMGGENSTDFAINSTTGYVTVARHLDSRRQALYILFIQATTSNSQTVSIVLRVFVLAAYRRAPVFTSSGPFLIQERRPAGTLVGVIKALDPESDTSSTITYSLVGGRASFLFLLSPTSGMLTTREVLSIQDLTAAGLFLPSTFSFTLLVAAQGAGAPPLFTISQVVVRLQEAPNNPPIFNVTAYFGTILEGMPPGTAVVRVQAIDQDLGSNGRITYSLSTSTTNTTSSAAAAGGGGVPFQVDQLSGVVNTTSTLDVEGNATYTFTVVASDGGVPPLSAAAVVTITVLDADDYLPMFLQSVYNFAILETYPPGELIDRVTAIAINDDQGVNAIRIVYTIQPHDPALPFSIGRTDGVISLNQDAVLNANVRSVYNFTIVAADAEVPRLNASATVIITLIKVNRTPPKFLGPCDASVLESIPVGTAVTVCTAIDIDSTTNTTINDVSYLIADGNIGNAFQFVLFDRLGTIVTRRPLNSTVTPSYTLTIVAANTFAFRSVMQVTITVLTSRDINHPPLFVDLPFMINISDSAIANYTTLVTTLIATDPDIGANGQVTYSILGTTQQGTQTLLTVQVTDAGSPPLSATANITLQFESLCSMQVYSIDTTWGNITAGLLCKVDLKPMETNITIGGNATLECSALGNLVAAYQFAHNDSFVTLPSMQNQLELKSVGFVDGGTYLCKVTTQAGSLQSKSATVSIQVPPMIAPPLQDQALELKRTALFDCEVTGVPPPVITWVRVTREGVTVNVLPSSRVSIIAQFLVISEVEDGDQGVYACIASNSAGTAVSSASLTIFGVSDAVMATIINFSMPSSNNTCNDFNISDFENIVSTITGFSAAVSVVSGDVLCPPSVCNPNPCRNGGSCQPDSLHIGGYQCVCDPGYTGMNCEQDIDECNSRPCLNGGTCANTVGSFSCTCPASFKGFRCQYSDVCLSAATPCSPDTTCIETTVRERGYICANLTFDGHLTVSTTALSGVQLEEIESTLLEAQSLSTVTRRRRSNSNDTHFSYDSCEARFIAQENHYILVWVCLPGAPPPGIELLNAICSYFSGIKGINWCRLPGNITVFESAPPPPPGRVNISFILLDPVTGAPLPSTTVLQVLAMKGAVEKMAKYGYEVTGFFEATAAADEHMPASKSTVSIVAGLTTPLALLVVICIIVFLFWIIFKRKNTKRTKLSRDPYSLSSIFSDAHYESGSLQESPYSLISAFEDTSAKNHQQPFKESSFDNPMYDYRYKVDRTSNSPHSEASLSDSSISKKVVFTSPQIR